jgi:hypothetical protein
MAFADMRTEIIVVDLAKSSRGTGDIQFLRFPEENFLHQFTGVEIAFGQRPAEAFGHGELSGGPAESLHTPQMDEATDRPAATAETADFAFGLGIIATASEAFGLIDEPFHENAGFFVAELACKRVVVEDVIQQGIGLHCSP